MFSLQFSFDDIGHIGFDLQVNDQTAKASYVRQNLVADFLRVALLMHSYNAETTTLRYNLSPEDEYWVFEKHANLVLKKIVSNEDDQKENGNILFDRGLKLEDFSNKLIKAAETSRNDFKNKDINFHDFEFPELELKALKAAL